MMYEIPTQANDVPGLEDYLRASRERWRLIVIVTILFVVLAVLFDRTRTPQYEGEARVVVNPTVANSANQSLQRPTLEREREVLASNAVAELAAEEIADGSTARRLLKDVDVSFVNDSDTLSIVYTDPDPTRAALVVNAIADSYVQLREEESIQVYTSQSDALTAELDELNARVTQIIADLGRVTAERERAFAISQEEPTRQALIDAASEEILLLSQERNVVNSSITTVTRELRTVERQRGSRPTTAQIIQYSDVPDSPSGPGRNLILAAGIAFGLMAGVALAFVLDRLDRTAKDAADIEGALGTTVLGHIPTYGFGARRGEMVMLSTTKNNRVQRVREAYRRARASLQFLQSSNDITSIMITSARPTEGKSSTVANLAVAAAQTGARVVIVSADLRRPTQERIFGVQAERGLSDYLNDPNVTDILTPIPGVDGLVIVPAGTLPPNPGELLASARFGALISDLSSQFDLVLVDMPPVLNAADAGAASPHVDGVLIVVDSQRTNTDALLRVRTTLERSGASIVGAVLNKDTTDTGLSVRRDKYAYEKVASQR